MAKSAVFERPLATTTTSDLKQTKIFAFEVGLFTKIYFDFSRMLLFRIYRHYPLGYSSSWRTYTHRSTMGLFNAEHRSTIQPAIRQQPQSASGVRGGPLPTHHRIHPVYTTKELFSAGIFVCMPSCSRNLNVAPPLACTYESFMVGGSSVIWP